MREIVEKINKAQNIVILTHISEDADAIGSSFALTTALRGIGKNIALILSDKPEERLQFLQCDYSVYEEGMNPLQDLVLCLDSADVKRLGERAVFLGKSESVSIDHHYTNTRYADVNYVDGDASSTGELVFMLLKEMEIPVTKELAEFLYISISGDTGSFKYSCTSSKTMRVVADLMDTGIDHAELSRRLHETEKIEAVLLKGHIMSQIKSFYEGKLRIVVLDKDIFEKFGVDEKNAGDVVNIPRTVEGTEIAVSVRETEEKIKVSFRSNGKYNVSDIAAVFGGGGHVMAAGAAVKNSTLDEVVEKIINAVGEYIND